MLLHQFYQSVNRYHFYDVIDLVLRYLVLYAQSTVTPIGTFTTTLLYNYKVDVISKISIYLCHTIFIFKYVYFFVIVIDMKIATTANLFSTM
jgi:hypothetical protein